MAPLVPGWTRCLLLFSLLAASLSNAYVVLAPRCRTMGRLHMGVLDGFKKAFENEDFKEKPSSGLKGGPTKVEVVVNGKRVLAVAGQRLPDVVRAAGAKVEYNCQKAECGTCESMVDGKKVRICKAVVPFDKKSITITTKKY